MPTSAISRLSCPQGSSCAAQPSNNVAGGCCRLGDASCILATACIESSSLSASCGSDCQANSYVTKCSNSATPYCYTRYWVSGAVTPSEVGCTTTQGVVAYAYTTYTGFGAEITQKSTAAGGTIAASDAGAVGLVSEQKGGNGGPGDGTSFAEQKTANGSVSSPAELSQRDAARPWAPAEGQWHEVPGRSTVPELP
ncbi:hypothetical protein CLAFUW4_13103 [Fulvia fulva]|uniref:Uncharacterized protein n=1 Tax=Passalora fulva TaxID=5499 RepID=A0A9Q8PJ67_PASFU|nr:uncharacterized protein CLAFUR5_12962 [Fulvia fulva]KAK4611998.1 hypothetical protein CLAFUR4_13107 [Fulvia fulva]KAK4612638.1 hypothetical protein CLAFUR0_13112 [Fulvia fulva]UJO23526.1 hypothetical protein CLAFUR5_12962 [Fulvia fulva]WPV20914.1 hypothetical protein CLAFUW4_13103 [Fulvia fulva]WPV36141.1 hypothetical protein CLAFUW7_13111 [Fulvia fulva]